jgi:hypothetical protein
MSAHERVSRGRAAKNELVLTEDAFETVREALFSAWQKADSLEHRERIWAAGNVLDLVKRVLLEAVNDGEMVAAESELMQGFSKGNMQ